MAARQLAMHDLDHRKLYVSKCTSSLSKFELQERMSYDNTLLLRRKEIGSEIIRWDAFNSNELEVCPIQFTKKGFIPASNKGRKKVIVDPNDSSTWTKAYMSGLCKDLKIPCSGSKATMMRRVEDHNKSLANKNCTNGRLPFK